MKFHGKSVYIEDGGKGALLELIKEWEIGKKTHKKLREKANWTFAIESKGRKL